MLRILSLTTALLTATAALSSAHAETLAEQRDRVNANVVTVMGGSVKGTYSKLTWDMSTRFDDGYDLRVLPVLGKGSFRGVEDLLLLRGIDVAMLQSDILDYMTDLGVFPNLDQQIRYLSVLYNEEVHIIANNDIETIQDLKGKRVNFGPNTSGTFITASIVFDELGLAVEALSESYQDGLQMLKEGKIDAMVRVAGAPVKLLEEVSWESGLKVLDIPAFDGPYFEAELDHDQYPGLIAQGKTVKTIAVAAVLAAYNFNRDDPRRQPIDKLYAKLGAEYTEFRQEPYHPKWQEIDFNRVLPGWSRWEPAEPSS